LNRHTILSHSENQTADPNSYSFAHLKPRAVNLAFGLEVQPTSSLANLEISDNRIDIIANIASQLPELHKLAGNAGSTLRIKIESDELNDALLRVSIKDKQHSGCQSVIFSYGRTRSSITAIRLREWCARFGIALTTFHTHYGVHLLMMWSFCTSDYCSASGVMPASVPALGYFSVLPTFPPRQRLS